LYKYGTSSNNIVHIYTWHLLF